MSREVGQLGDRWLASKCGVGAAVSGTRKVHHKLMVIDERLTIVRAVAPEAAGGGVHLQLHPTSFSG
jgi:hypothetical protein